MLISFFLPSPKRPGGAAGYCTIGCGRFDDFDSMILLLMSSSAVLLLLMVATRWRR